MGAEILAYKSKRNEIAARKTGEYEYEAKSESKERKWYRIAHVLGKRYCECKGFAHAGRACKHIAAMKKLYDAKPPLRRRAADTCAFASPDGLAGRSRRLRSSAGSADRKSSVPRS